MPRTSAKVKNRYIAKAYDRLNIIVPKGRKAALEGACKASGESLNGFTNRLYRTALGVSESEWKRGVSDEE